MEWLLALLPLVPPAMPLIAWPLAARLIPPVQKLAAGLYAAAWWLGVVAGFTWGLWIGGFIGAVVTVAIASLSYWGFFKKVRVHKCVTSADDFLE